MTTEPEDDAPESERLPLLTHRINLAPDGSFDELVVSAPKGSSLIHAEMMNPRAIFVSVGEVRIWAGINEAGELEVTWTEGVTAAMMSRTDTEAITAKEKARADAAEAERDRFRTAACERDNEVGVALARAEAAEVKVRALDDALAQIADNLEMEPQVEGSALLRCIKGIANAALDSTRG